MSCWSRGISHGVPSHLSHSLNPSRLVITKSQYFSSPRVCVRISVCLQDKAALSSTQWEKEPSWLRSCSVGFSQADRRRTNWVNQPRLLSGRCCDRRKREGWGNTKRLRQGRKQQDKEQRHIEKAVPKEQCGDGNKSGTETNGIAMREGERDEM